MTPHPSFSTDCLPLTESYRLLLRLPESMTQVASARNGRQENCIATGGQQKPYSQTLGPGGTDTMSQDRIRLELMSELNPWWGLEWNDAWNGTWWLHSFVLSKLPWPFVRSLEFSPHILASATARCLSVALGASLLLPV